MGGEGLLTDWLETLNSRFGTPSRAISVTGAGIVALVVLPVSIDVLAEVASFLYLVTYGLVHVAVVRLRGNDGYDPHFRIPSALYPAVPILGVLATLAIMTQMNPVVIAGGAVLVAASVAWYFLYVRVYKE
jgi:amino acid transporter